MSVTASASPETARAGFESLARHLTANIDVTLEWLAALPVSAKPESRALEKYFKQARHTSLFSQLGVPQPLWLTPIRFKPEQGFHRLTTRDLNEYVREQVRLPYEGVALGPEHVAQITNVSAELFPGNFLVTRVAAKLSVPCKTVDDALLSLSQLRSPKNLPVVDGLIRRIAGFVQGHVRDMPKISAYSTYFAMQAKLPGPLDKFNVLAESLRHPLVALLIGTEGPELLRDGLIDKVWAASEELNAKAAAELLLLNRQGFLHIVPAGPYRGPHLHRFVRTRDLAVIGLYAREFLREGHDFGTAQAVEADDIVRRMRQWINYPRTTFDASVSHTWSWLALVDQLLLPERLDAWEDYFGKST